MPEPVTLAGVKLHVAWCESPDSDSATLPVKPLIAPTDTVYATAVPAVAVRDAGDTPSEKSGTTNETAVEWTREPLVAVIVSGYVPGASEAAVETVSCAPPRLLRSWEALKLQLACAAVSPESDSATSPVKPPTAVVDTV